MERKDKSSKVFICMGKDQCNNYLTTFFQKKII